MLNVYVLLALAAFVVTVLSGMGKAPVWVAVLLLCMIHLLGAVR